MNKAKFILSKENLIRQVQTLEKLGLKISYSYKTNRVVGKVLQELKECENVDFSIHAFEEIKDIQEKNKIWFFTQAESEEELKILLKQGIKNFVIDNSIDLKRILGAIEKEKIKINLSLRMKFQEHRIGSGKYFVYGMSSKKINEEIKNIKDNLFLEKLGIHIHRKSQNTSEWEIIEEIEDSLTKESLKRINMINLGGGLPSIYRSSSSQVFPYIFDQIKKCVLWLKEKNIKTIIEPGRFLAAPCIILETEIIQKYDKNLILNTTIYNCALDNILTGTKMLVENELKKEEKGESYLLKGNSPTRDDIFRYNVKLNNPKVGDKIIFLNAGAYNYTTDFFGYTKLNTKIVDTFENDKNCLDAVRIIKIPTSQGSLGKNIGCENAPDEITSKGIIAKIDKDDFTKTIKNLEEIQGDLFIGGDHSITYPLVKNFVKNNSNPGLIIFDAHPDCTNNFSPPTHEDFVNVLIAEKILDPKNILLIGLRKIDKIEKEFLEKNNVKHFLFNDIKNGTIDLDLEIEKFSQGKNLYVSVDIDVLNPTDAPGTGYIEKEGFTLNEILGIINNLKKIKRADIVEINPKKDIENKTIVAGRKIFNLLLRKISKD